jgi:hypothetical protein
MAESALKNITLIGGCVKHKHKAVRFNIMSLYLTSFLREIILFCVVSEELLYPA